MASDIQVYGTDWCGLTRHVREFLMTSRFEYDYFDIDRDDDAQQFVLSMNDGRRRFPLVVVKHQVVTQPTVAVLTRAIREHGLQPSVRTTRLIVRRFGPDAATAGVNRAQVAMENPRPRTHAGRRIRRRRNNE